MRFSFRSTMLALVLGASSAMAQRASAGKAASPPPQPPPPPPPLTFVCPATMSANVRIDWPAAPKGFTPTYFLLHEPAVLMEEAFIPVGEMWCTYGYPITFNSGTMKGYDGTGAVFRYTSPFPPGKTCKIVIASPRTFVCT